MKALRPKIYLLSKISIQQIKHMWAFLLKDVDISKEA